MTVYIPGGLKPFLDKMNWTYPLDEILCHKRFTLGLHLIANGGKPYANDLLARYNAWDDLRSLLPTSNARALKEACLQIRETELINDSAA
jgi:hypothetical protein